MPVIYRRECMHEIVIRLQLTLILGIVLLGSSTHAFAINARIEVTVDTANIRAQPSTNSRVIGSLKKGQQIIGDLTNEEWWLILSPEGMVGYISDDKVRIVQRLSVSPGAPDRGNDHHPRGEDASKPHCDASTARFSLSIKKSVLTCKESYFSSTGYDRCNVHLKIEIDSDCPEDFMVDVYCKAKLRFRKSGFYYMNSATVTRSETIHVKSGRGYGIVTLKWKPHLGNNTIAWASVTERKCRIDRVMDSR